MGTPAYVGLRTGAGASGGLQKMLERMRAEEQLANQGRQVDINAFEAQSRADLEAARIGESQRQFNMQQPGRDALTEQTTLENTGLGIKNQMLQGLVPIAGGAGGPQGGSPGAAGGGGSLAGMDNPEGRLRLSLAGITPSGVFQNRTNEEQMFDAYAKKIGKTSANDLSFDERAQALKQMPAYGLATQRINISEAGLGIRKEELALRKQMHEMRMKQAEQDLANNTDPLQRQMALAAFRNRLQYEVEVQSNLNKWLNGEDPDKDPWTQIQRIADEVRSQMGTKAPAAGSGTGRGAGAQDPTAAAGDLDAILSQRRMQRNKVAGPVMSPNVAR